MIIDDIRIHIRKGLDQLGDNDSMLKHAQLIPFLGNGSTRIALNRANQTDQSYFSLVSEACLNAKLPPLEHLMSFGYTTDECLRMAIDRSGNGEHIKNDVLRKLWDLVNGIPPAPFYDVLARCAKGYITTNYDHIIERSLKMINLYHPDSVAIPNMEKNNETPINWMSRDIPGGGTYPFVIKMHGGFPSFPADVNFDEKVPGSYFNSWLNIRGADSIVVSEMAYNHWAFGCNAEKFEEKFKKMIQILQNRNNLLLFMGHGLRAEERIIWRLLEYVNTQTKNPPASMMVITHDSLQDLPSLRFPNILHRINIPPGIASSPTKREFACLILLQELIDQEIISSSSVAKSALSDALDKFSSPRIYKGSIEYSKMDSLINCLGQIAFHTYRGYMDAPSQERAYQPGKASWTPNTDTDSFLDISESLGSGLVPSFVFDALGIPNALYGRVGFDHAGRTILKHLQTKTENTNFSGVIQDQYRTETATIACWMDIRVILDAPRDLFGVRSTYNCSPAQMADDKESVFYVTKPYIEQVINAAKQQDTLIVDTGGRCPSRILSELCNKKSVILFSAVPFLQFLNGCNASTGNLDEADQDFHDRFRRNEPTDDTGRHYQLLVLFDYLKKYDFNLNKHPIKTQLEKGVMSLGCSLGPLGFLWWEKGSWDTAYWTRIQPKTIRADHEKVAGQLLPFSSIRNGLGCGDVARALFAASYINSKIRDVPFSVCGAYHSAVWGGGSRIMFWSLHEYFDWLKSTINEEDAISHFADMSKVYTPMWPDQNDYQIICTPLNSDLDLINEYTSIWNKIFSDNKSDRYRPSEWYDAVDAWKKARCFVDNTNV